METSSDFHFFDPYPGQPYLAKKKALCPQCKSKTTDSANTEDNENLLKWTKDADCVPKTFNYVNILEYSKLCGKKSKDIVEKPINRGYTLFFDGYVHDVSTSKTSNFVHIKSKCFKSMKKNEAPHNCKVSIDIEGHVKNGKCSCVAGASGFCNHIFALLYTLDHSVKMKVKEFGRSLTCTEKPSQWTKSRTDGVRAESVMTSSVVKPRFGNVSSGIRPLLQDTRAKTAQDGVNLNEAVDKLKRINPLIGICQIANVETVPMVETRLPVSAPVGSPLSYQLSKTEGDFSVTANCNQTPNDIVGKSETIPQFPWIERNSLINSIHNDVLEDLKLTLTQDEAAQLELQTKEQSNSKAWFAARKFRLTASKFGRILSRKKDKSSFIREYLLTPKDLCHVPAVKYGTQNEEVAVQKYVSFMNNSRKKTKVFKSGVVVNSKLPWLAASPDRIVYNDDVGFGLLEVKCAYSKKSVTPKDACSDPRFFCSYQDEMFSLKSEHDYFAQVQGQLGICGASYCDFIVYTNRGLGIQRILYDEHYFSVMVMKLKAFFLDHFVEVVKKQILLEG